MLEIRIFLGLLIAVNASNFTTKFKIKRRSTPIEDIGGTIYDEEVIIHDLPQNQTNEQIKAYYERDALEHWRERMGQSFDPVLPSIPSRGMAEKMDEPAIIIQPKQPNSTRNSTITHSIFIRKRVHPVIRHRTIRYRTTTLRPFPAKIMRYGEVGKVHKKKVQPPPPKEILLQKPRLSNFVRSTFPRSAPQTVESDDDEREDFFGYIHKIRLDIRRLIKEIESVKHLLHKFLYKTYEMTWRKRERAKKSILKKLSLIREPTFMERDRILRLELEKNATIQHPKTIKRRIKEILSQLPFGVKYNYDF